ncbi:hypothetical protein [Rheinheimera sp. NSM]|uniref:hypothetical protein n=1 Tax=Rheinheimera sp. NSM TaxID=3457884 RepID=UPI004034FE1D
MTQASLAALFILTVTAMPLSVTAKPLWLTDMDESALVYNSVPGIDINAATRLLLLEHMPGHQDSVTIVNNERAFQILKADTLACTGNKVRNSERESFAYFSDVPQLIFPGLRLYMLKATAEKAGIAALQHDSRHSFADISARLPRSRIGIVGGRNYGELLQAIFDQLAARKRIYTRTGNDMSAAAMLDMLVNGRVDLVVEYPNVVQYYSEALNHAVELVSVEISEATEYTGGYIMCSKTEQGKKLAQAYSNAIQLASKDKRYLQAHLRWFDVSSHHKVTALYNKVYKTEF